MQAKWCAHKTIQLAKMNSMDNYSCLWAEAFAVGWQPGHLNGWSTGYSAPWGCSI